MDIDEILAEIIDHMETQGDFTHENFNEAIDDVLEDRHEDGEIHDDTEMVPVKEALRARWPDVEKQLSK